jgi:hypothetical protein
MLERIKADFNQMQLVLAHQTATQIDSDLLAISKELEILGRHVKGTPDNIVDSSIRTFNERTYLKGVEAAGLINSENEVSHYSEFDEISPPFSKEGFVYREMLSLPPLTLGPLLPLDKGKGITDIYGFLCQPIESTVDEKVILFAMIPSGERFYR